MHSLIKKGVQPFERFLGTDVEYLARGGFWLFLGSSAGAFVAFLLSVAYAHFIPKEVYGSYRYIITVFNMAGIFALSGIALAITRAAARGFDRTLIRGAKTMILSSTGVAAVGIILAGYFFSRGETALGWGFLVASPFVPFFEGLGNWRGYLDGKKEFRKKTEFNIISHAVYGFLMAAAIGAILFLDFSQIASIALLAGTYFAAHAATNTLFFLKTMHLMPKVAREEPGAIRYGIHLSLSGIPSTIATYLDGILLFHFLGPAPLAVYSFAIALPEQLKAVFNQIGTTTIPKLSQHTENRASLEHLKKTLAAKALKATLPVAVLVIAYIFAAPFLYRILFPLYVESIRFSQIFALSLLMFPFTIFRTALKTEGNVKKIYLYTVSAPLIQILILFLLIPQFGLWGAVWGRVIGRVLDMLFGFILFQRT